MKKDILKIFSSNLIKMMVTFITAFLVPMVLSVDDYGYYKIYTFYAAYIGVLHCGYCDGIYLEYGGKGENEISRDRMSGELATIFTYSVGLALIACTWGIVRGDFTIICLGLTVVPNIVYTFYSYVYQATGDFKKYTLMLNFSTVSNLLLNGLLVLFQIRDYRAYIVACVIVQMISFIVGTFYFKQSGWTQKSRFSAKVLIKYIKMGVLLMLGNFAYTFFIGIDKWFIKFTLSITDFSMYSFASQMLTVVNMFITPISMTLYSHFSRRKDHEFERKVKQLLVAILMLMPVVIYAVSFVVETFMTKYCDSINLVSLLLTTQIFLSLNLAVFVNLYKSYKMQNSYIRSLLVALGIAVLFDFTISAFSPNAVLYAGATMLSCIIWLSINETKFPFMKPTVKDLIYVFSLLLLFFVLEEVNSNIFLKAFVYTVVYLIVTRILKKSEWTYLIKILYCFANKICVKNR